MSGLVPVKWKDRCDPGGNGREVLGEGFLVRDESPRFLLLPRPQPPNTYTVWLPSSCLCVSRTYDPRTSEPWRSRRWGGEKDQWATGNSMCSKVSYRVLSPPGLMKDGTLPARRPLLSDFPHPSPAGLCVGLGVMPSLYPFAGSCLM